MTVLDRAAKNRSPASNSWTVYVSTGFKLRQAQFEL